MVGLPPNYNETLHTIIFFLIIIILGIILGGFIW